MQALKSSCLRMKASLLLTKHSFALFICFLRPNLRVNQILSGNCEKNNDKTVCRDVKCRIIDDCIQKQLNALPKCFLYFTFVQSETSLLKVILKTSSRE